MALLSPSAPCLFTNVKLNFSAAAWPQSSPSLSLFFSILHALAPPVRHDFSPHSFEIEKCKSLSDVSSWSLPFTHDDLRLADCAIVVIVGHLRDSAPLEMTGSVNPV